MLGSEEVALDVLQVYQVKASAVVVTNAKPVCNQIYSIFYMLYLMNSISPCFKGR